MKTATPIIVVFIVFSGLALSGCGPVEVADFAVGERLAAQQHKSLLVYYKSWLSSECSMMQGELQNPKLQPLLSDKVICILLEDYEPNQRFVAQYGVDRYPALILVHPDKTYHSRIGALGVEHIVNFLETAKPPGSAPWMNAQIPRPVEYEWVTDYPTAFRVAREQNRRLFIFYKSVISPEATEVLTQVLNRPDVAAYFSEMVNCRLDWGHPPNRKLMAQYGITNVPGFLIIGPDGTYHARQGAVTAEQLIGFVHQARTSSGLPAPPGF